MLLDGSLNGSHHRPSPAGAPLTLVPAAPARACAIAPPAASAATTGVEAEVLEGLLGGDLPTGPLLEAIADLTASALQQGASVGVGIAPAEVRGVAARVATGLAVALLQSDLAERISARLAAEAPFADGWRSCPE